MRPERVIASVLAICLCAGLASAQERTGHAELEQARQELEAAAHRIAELSAGSFVPIQEHGRGSVMPAPRAVLGVNVEDDELGARVVGVTPGGGADEAGVETGDVIVAMDGAALDGGQGRSPSEVLVAQMGNVRPGDTVVLTVLRGDDRQDLSIQTQAARGPAFGYAVPPGGPGMPPFDLTRQIRRWADMELVELSPGLGAYFGTDKGVLVVRAPRDSTLGLMDGDVILAISGREPMGVGHALRILGSFEPGERLELTIMREQRRRTLEVEIPSADTGD